MRAYAFTYVVLYFAVILVSLKTKNYGYKKCWKIPHFNKRRAPNKRRVYGSNVKQKPPVFELVAM